MGLLVVYVRRERLRHVVDCVLYLVEVLVDAIEPTTNERVVVGIFLPGSFDEGSRETRRYDGERPDRGYDDRFTHGRSSPRT